MTTTRRRLTYSAASTKPGTTCRARLILRNARTTHATCQSLWNSSRVTRQSGTPSCFREPSALRPPIRPVASAREGLLEGRRVMAHPDRRVPATCAAKNSAEPATADLPSWEGSLQTVRPPSNGTNARPRRPSRWTTVSLRLASPRSQRTPWARSAVTVP
jgi:hypothetical protein